jgi:hypothetical protein
MPQVAVNNRRRRTYYCLHCYKDVARRKLEAALRRVCRQHKIPVPTLPEYEVWQYVRDAEYMREIAILYVPKGGRVF